MKLTTSLLALILSTLALLAQPGPPLQRNPWTTNPPSTKVSGANLANASVGMAQLSAVVTNLMISPSVTNFNLLRLTDYGLGHQPYWTNVINGGQVDTSYAWDTALTNAMNAVAASHGVVQGVFLGPGIFYFASPIQVPPGVSLVGVGILHDPSAGMLNKTNNYSVIWCQGGVRFPYTDRARQGIQNIEICGATNPLIKLIYGAPPLPSVDLSLNNLPESAMGNVGMLVEGDLDGTGFGSWTGVFECDNVMVSGFKICIVSDGNCEIWKKVQTSGRFGFLSPGVANNPAGDPTDSYTTMTNYMATSGFNWFVTNYLSLIKNRDGSIKTRFYPADQNTFINPMNGNYISGVAWVFGSARGSEPIIINDCSGCCQDYAWLMGNTSFSVHGANSELGVTNDCAIRVFGEVQSVSRIDINIGRWSFPQYNVKDNYNVYASPVTNWSFIYSYAPMISGRVRDIEITAPAYGDGLLMYTKHGYDRWPFEVTGIGHALGAYKSETGKTPNQNFIVPFPVGANQFYHPPMFQPFNEQVFHDYGVYNLGTNLVTSAIPGLSTVWRRGVVGLLQGNPDYYSGVIELRGLTNKETVITQHTNALHVRFITSDPEYENQVSTNGGIISTNVTVANLRITGSLSGTVGGTNVAGAVAYSTQAGGLTNDGVHATYAVAVDTNQATVFEIKGTNKTVALFTGWLMKSNALSGWPAVAVTPGDAYFGNSNGVIYILTSEPGATAWTATNQIAP